MADKAIEVLLDEKRNFPPPKEFKKSANMKTAACQNDEGLDRLAMFTMSM